MYVYIISLFARALQNILYNHRQTKITGSQQFLLCSFASIPYTVRTRTSCSQTAHDLGNSRRDAPHSLTIRRPCRGVSTDAQHALPHIRTDEARSAIAQALVFCREEPSCKSELAGHRLRTQKR